MNDNQQPLPSLHQVLGPALHKAFLRAAELAKQTRTYLVVQERDNVRHIPYHEIDEFVRSGVFLRNKK